MLKQTSMEPLRLTLCGCSVLQVAARPNPSGQEFHYPVWRRT
jgi:hypothetical protein